MAINHLTTTHAQGQPLAMQTGLHPKRGIEHIVPTVVI